MEPFVGSVAVRDGHLTRRALARHHRPVFRDVYVPRDVELTAQIKAHAAWLASGAVLGGTSAAAVLGAKWIDPNAPAEIVRADRHAAPGMIAHSWALAPARRVSSLGSMRRRRHVPLSTWAAPARPTRPFHSSTR